MNKVLQGSGGASDLYDDTDAIALYMLAGPDCVRILDEFENIHKLPNGTTNHHEQAHHLQLTFLKDIKSFMKVVTEMGNPFLATGHELVALDTCDVMENEVAMSLSKITELGKTLHSEYVDTRLTNATVPVSHTIKRNNSFTFSNRPDTRKKGEKVGMLKQNTTLITQLFLSLQSRPEADMVDFFKYENQREPPSLSDRGLLRAGNKSDILTCIKAPTARVCTARQVSVMFFDMAAIIHMVRPTRAVTFAEYVSLNVVPFLENQLTSTVKRVDAIWDTYPESH